jgi:hypothetical protein
MHQLSVLAGGAHALLPGKCECWSHAGWTAPTGMSDFIARLYKQQYCIPHRIYNKSRDKMSLSGQHTTTHTHTHTHTNCLYIFLI